MSKIALNQLTEDELRQHYDDLSKKLKDHPSKAIEEEFCYCVRELQIREQSMISFIGASR